MSASDHSAGYFIWEILKLAAQLGGAILVARYTVKLALDRFKSEKGWERTTSVLADMMSNIGHMQAINERWLDAELSKRKYTDEYSAKLAADYQAARRDFQRATGLARLLLPDEVYLTARKLDEELNTSTDYWQEQVEHNLRAIEEAIQALAGQGKMLLKGKSVA